MPPGRPSCVARRPWSEFWHEENRFTGSTQGFGKLASVRIEVGILETLQRNIVLSHAAGVGEADADECYAADDGARSWRGVVRRAPPAWRPQTVAMLEAVFVPEV